MQLLIVITPVVLLCRETIESAIVVKCVHCSYLTCVENCNYSSSCCWSFSSGAALAGKGNHLLENTSKIYRYRPSSTVGECWDSVWRIDDLKAISPWQSPQLGKGRINEAC